MSVLAGVATAGGFKRKFGSYMGYHGLFNRFNKSFI